MTDPAFLASLLQIVAIDILLGGDNAVVIALACRRLPDAQRRKAIFGGVAGAVVLRILLLFVASYVLGWPLLKVVGGVLLLWIGIKLMVPQEDEADVKAGTTFGQAIWIIIVADVVMSLDNVIAVAGAAQGHLGLAITGVLISIPIIIFGSQVILKLMEAFRWLVVAGAALLGWIAGKLIASDELLQSWLGITQLHWVPHAAGVMGLLIVLIAGWMLARRPVAV
ncbi:TerC family protein [Pseudomonas oryzihabitans]|uniref:TerC family protein n=1 Tax=Pseudomonas oryzihabitans TaxID=47885 RepID=UPI003987D57E